MFMCMVIFLHACAVTVFFHVYSFVVLWFSCLIIDFSFRCSFVVIRCRIAADPHMFNYNQVTNLYTDASDSHNHDHDQLHDFI